MSVGHSPGEPQWAPDMPKGQGEITEADKAEAKRRIQGQVASAEEESPDESGSGEEVCSVVVMEEEGVVTREGGLVVV